MTEFALAILALALVAVGVLALISRRAYRQIDQDFPHSGIGAMDAATATRYRAETEATRKPERRKLAATGQDRE